MSARIRFILAVGAIGLLVSGPFFVTAAVVWADMQELERSQLLKLLVPRLPLGAMFTVIAFILGVFIVRNLFRQYVQGLLRMAEQLRLMLGANRNFRVAAEGPPEVQRLAEAANDLAEQRDDLLTDVEAQIARAKASIEEEKNRLAALMSELSQSVVVCNLDGRILLYNTRARLQFKALAQGPTSTATGGALIGLGRSIFAIFERNQITHALDNISQRLSRGGAEPVANFVTTTHAGQLLRIQMAPVLSAPADDGTAAGPVRTVAGYVLTMDNITRAYEQEGRRDQMLTSLTEGGRSALASIRAAVENLIDYPDMDAEQRERFVRIIGDEARDMSVRLDQTMNQFADSLKTRWPLEEMLGVDLVAAVQRRVAAKLALPTKTEELEDALWVKVDSFSLMQALTYLASKLKDDYDVREVRFRLSSEGRLAYFDLIWQGPPVSSEAIHSWEIEPMNVAGEATPMTLRDVTDRHGGEIWFQREKTRQRAFFRIVVPVANPQEAPSATDAAARGDSRPEYYDFDLFNFTETSEALLDRKLSELVYTVFDTETTGLLPSEGDEIIQIGAARIVNGRLLSNEIFDQLVDPQRSLRPESVHIHGITEDMLGGQPTIATILPAFHQFAAETVLVAHNAAFDMRFLQLKEDATGIRFGQPVLDTLLLSAVVHPNQETHKLEAIAERLGINVIGRHTALGDAFVTGEVFLKLIPLLADMGITTLRDALAASEKTYLARVKY